MSVRRPALLAVLSCAVVLAAPTVATAGPPPRIACGTTLTTSAVLRHDLTCKGDGLRLAAGVSLDLHGHTLRGSGAGVGVLVAPDGTSGIRNGTLTGWGAAVDIAEVPDEDYPDGEYPGAGPLVVDKVRFHANVSGLEVSGQSGTGRYAKPTTVTRSTFTGHTREAIGGGWFARVTVDGSTFTENRLVVHSGGEAAFTRSRFERNDLAIAANEASVRVTDSTFVNNPRAIRTFSMASAIVDGSTFTGSDVALDGGGSWVDVKYSTFANNARAVVIGELGAAVVGNKLRHNGEAIGTSSTVDGWFGPSVVEGNVLRGNGQGIVLVVLPGAVSVGRNDVRGSTGWGIHVPGAVDLGGNTASGNGSSPQCVGVVCRTS